MLRISTAVFSHSQEFDHGNLTPVIVAVQEILNEALVQHPEYRTTTRTNIRMKKVKFQGKEKQFLRVELRKPIPTMWWAIIAFWVGFLAFLWFIFP